MSDDDPTDRPTPTSPTATGQFRAAITDGVGLEVKKLLGGFAEELKKEFREEMRGARGMMKEHADQNFRSHESTRRQVVHMTRMTATLWKDVRGSDPPPLPPAPGDDTSFSEAAKEIWPQPPGARPARPLDDLTEDVATVVDKTSSHDNDIAGVQGRLLTVEAQTGEVLKLVKEQMGKKDGPETRSLLTRLVDGLLWSFREREGQRYTLTLIAGITGLITALGTTYAIATGRLPMPTSPPPVPALRAPAR